MKDPSSIEKPQQSKKKITEDIDSESEIIQSSTATVAELADDDPVLRAMEQLLEPMRADIQALVSSHKELKSDYNQITKLREENLKLSEHVQKVETLNVQLNKRVCELENRILQNNVIIHSIREGTWETEAVHQEKLYEAFSETVTGRTIEERLDTVRTMYITGTKRIGKCRSMSSRLISVEFLYKSDADYLLQNCKYLAHGIYIDREYCK